VISPTDTFVISLQLEFLFKITFDLSSFAISVFQKQHPKVAITINGLTHERHTQLISYETFMKPLVNPCID
jgi:hypothetical protein